MNLINKNYLILLKFLLTLWCLIIYTTNGFCGKVIVIGPTYLIIEEDVLDYIHHRLNTLEKEGQFQKLKTTLIDQTKKKIDRPKTLQLRQATRNKSWTYDPSFKVPYDISDHKGKIIARKGEIFNPLHIVSLKQTLIFFDSDSNAQVAFVKNKIKLNDSKVKLILINGSILTTNQLFQLPIYFDQEGLLTKKFGIRHVPTLVYQVQDHLRVDEVMP